ncbi:MAG TPA: hypothetical protein VJ767_03215 [Nitrososphaeraceae archaeon]|nr:hypothetical protein [Nitrososphaeraceae archaeon]
MSVVSAAAKLRQYIPTLCNISASIKYESVVPKTDSKYDDKQ